MSSFAEVKESTFRHPSTATARSVAPAAAKGGLVPHDEGGAHTLPRQRALKPSIQDAVGTKARAHPGRLHRAKGGRVRKGKTVVNVNVTPTMSPGQPVPVPVPAQGAPRPPMPPAMPPGAAGVPPSGLGPRPGVPVGPVPPRKYGGRAR
jgi:hypothetical protein